MSPLAKLLQIQPATATRPTGWNAGSIWSRFIAVLRSARVQRRVRRLEIVERVTLGNKQSVALFRVDQREFVVGCCGESLVLLVSPHAEPVKVQAVKQKRTRRARVTKAKPSVVAAAPVNPSVLFADSVAKADVLMARTSASKSANEIDPLLKSRVPSKARLLKSFAGRAR